MGSQRLLPQEYVYKMPVLRSLGVSNACGTLYRAPIAMDIEKFERKQRIARATADEWAML